MGSVLAHEALISGSTLPLHLVCSLPSKGTSPNLGAFTASCSWACYGLCLEYTSPSLWLPWPLPSPQPPHHYWTLWFSPPPPPPPLPFKTNIATITAPPPPHHYPFKLEKNSSSSLKSQLELTSWLPPEFGDKSLSELQLSLALNYVTTSSICILFYLTAYPNTSYILLGSEFLTERKYLRRDWPQITEQWGSWGRKCMKTNGTESRVGCICPSKSQKLSGVYWSWPSTELQYDCFYGLTVPAFWVSIFIGIVVKQNYRAPGQCQDHRHVGEINSWTSLTGLEQSGGGIIQEGCLGSGKPLRGSEVETEVWVARCGGKKKRVHEEEIGPFGFGTHQAYYSPTPWTSHSLCLECSAPQPSHRWLLFTQISARCHRHRETFHDHPTQRKPLLQTLTRAAHLKH